MPFLARSDCRQSRQLAQVHGPRTPEGKSRSRENSYKHGLTGEGVVLSTEDAEKVAGRFTVLMDEFAPQTLMGCILVKRTAMLSVRLDRSYEQEAKALSARVLSAETDYDDRRKAEAEYLLHNMVDCPATHYRRLMTTPEGVKLMIAKWRAMKADLDHDEGCRWNFNHYQAADHLHGLSGGMVEVSPYVAWSMAIHGSYVNLKPDHFVNMKTDEDCRRLAMDKVAEMIDADILRLEAHLATLDTRSIEANRAFAPGKALFDPSHQAALARKYEAAAERGMYRGPPGAEASRVRATG